MPNRDAAATGPELVAAALELAELGFYMVPVVPGTKRPPSRLARAMLTLRQTTPRSFHDYFGDGDMEIAPVLHVSGHVALDVDLKVKEVDVAGAFVKFEQKAGYGLVNRLSDVTATETTPNRVGITGSRCRREFPRRTQLRPAVAGIELQQHLLSGRSESGAEVVTSPRARASWSCPGRSWSGAQTGGRVDGRH